MDKPRIFRIIAMQPRSSLYFTDGNLGVAPFALNRWLEEMVRDDLIVKDMDDLYWITPKGVEQANQKQETVAPRTYCAASTPAGSYVPPSWRSVRAGADDHRRYASRGIDA